MINFEQIKNELVVKGIAYQEMADVATQKIIDIAGERGRDGKVFNLKVRAGWKIGDFGKCLKVEHSIDENDTDDQIEMFYKNTYPDAKVYVNID